MKKPKAERVVDAVLRELNGRGGFDHWWDTIDPVIQAEIRHDLVNIVQREVSK